MAKRRTSLPPKHQAWVDARERLHLSHAHVQMARELGMNPRKLGGKANHEQEPWKLPLPEFIEELYFKRFGRTRPDNVRPVEQMVRDGKRKQAERKARKQEQRARQQVERGDSAGEEDAGRSEVGCASAPWGDPHSGPRGDHDLMTQQTDPGGESSAGWRLFEAEAAYAESIFREALGDLEASIAAARRALEIKPDYPPAVLTVGSIEYQCEGEAEGRRLFFSLLALPDEDGDLWEVIDKAGDFLIDSRRYADGLELYRRAVERFPDRSVLHRGLSCCAGHEGSLEEAVAASQKAVELEPESQAAMNDLGWSLLEAGRLHEAREALLRAVAMDPSDELARGNLQLCEERLSKR